MKDLPKLIICDFSGNPMCTSHNYRLFSIYYLRRLKVLDGVAVDGEEQSSAKDVYSGRLTLELLEEKIGECSVGDGAVSLGQPQYLCFCAWLWVVLWCCRARVL